MVLKVSFSAQWCRQKEQIMQLLMRVCSWIMRVFMRMCYFQRFKVGNHSCMIFLASASLILGLGAVMGGMQISIISSIVP